MKGDLIYDILDGMKYGNVDSETDGWSGNPCTYFKIWLDEVKDSQWYLFVSGKENPDNSWTIRCRKLKNGKGTHSVKNTVPVLTSQSLDDLVDDWFESNKGAEALQVDDWDTGDQYL